MPRHHALAIALAVAIVYSCAPAHGRERGPIASATPTPAQPAVVEMERITVGGFRPDIVQIGTFRDAMPLEIPQLSHVITRPVLDAQQASGLYDALRNTAGVTRAQLSGAAFDNLAIRGILVENRANYRLNGSLPVINLIDIPLENKERVEVLKGVSSLYFGLVPPSGIVNLVTKRAGPTPVSTLTLSGNSHGAAQLHADVARRFGAQEQFGVRVNLAGGREANGVRRFDGNSHLASAALDWQATDTLKFALDLEHYAKNVSDPAALAVPAPVAGRITLPSVPNARLNLADRWMRYDARSNNALWRMDWNPTERWSLQVDAGTSQVKRDRYYSQFENYDLGSGDGQLRVIYTPNQVWQNRNLRAQLTGRFGTGFIRQEVTVGYSSDRRNQEPRAATVYRFSQNLYNPRPIPRMTLPTPQGTNLSTIRDDGLYLFDRISFGEQWQAQLGVRSDRYRSQSRTTRYRAKELLPSAALLWRPREDTSIYTSYVEGLEESGWGQANRANFGELLPPTRARQYELGGKLQAGGVLLQAAVFDIRRPSTNIDASNRIVLNGLSRFRGLEMVASGELRKGLELIASALWLDARQLSRANADTYGRTPVNTPRYTASVFTRYRLPTLPTLALSTGVYLTGRRPVDNENRAFIGSYATWSLGMEWEPQWRRPFALRLMLDNVANRNYWSTAGNGLIGVGTPRTLSLQARWGF
ncbi:MAG TPA: TonB-dependent siderophore receptor [Stenotrophomonas sp.]|nr:TonB-dependent siderophore receptor [Stenotrophomonas sp.]